MNNKVHRVRFFTMNVTWDHSVTKSEEELFWEAGNLFKQTPKAQWVDINNVELFWFSDKNSSPFGKKLMFYGNLDDKQMIDYTLRFCDGTKDWK